MSNILVVDDEPSICWTLEQALADDGHEVVATSTAEEALQIAERLRPDVVVMDIRLPGMDGLEALEALKNVARDTPVIMITAFGNLDTAVQAIKRGAFEYLTKPFDLEDAIQVVRRALGSKPSSAVGEHAPLPQDMSQTLLGSSPGMQAVFRKIAMVAPHDVPVLITGESGTGKELVAAAIHRYSNRSSGLFIPVCIPAMNESVLESELFGHSRGAFTGAVVERRGLLQAADGGTAFLDEIGDISLATQVKILRVLETKAITSVGRDEQYTSDFRLVAATHRNLEEMVGRGEFREDLFYRLSVFRIVIPPLRERMEDIPVLARHFIWNVDPRRVVSLSPSALEELVSRPWNGNIRELRNVIEHAVIVTRSGEISPHSFPPPMRRGEEIDRRPQLNQALREWWKETYNREESPTEGMHEAFLSAAEPVIMEEALKVTGGNRQEAARILGLHRQTLREKIRKYGLNPNPTEDE
ncbi:sigma-54-dependent transcriptional regulator [Rubinisphaera margarita]|uniref:sigma-54-dependent transcriptional regulator n=1 Tax=Rubinisphaera margarita TaxID=2909586 RepID=UPI001EE88E23|nr:sigma-54 dependent transcriptional regulator [Rubinisphaera margarita]MCG6158309.1 sigma-54 dependent transcriptional regulator [Rubinisphaera margarita]